jgi:hypothetical protein
MCGGAGACEGAPGRIQRFSATVTTWRLLAGIPVGTGRSGAYPGGRRVVERFMVKGELGGQARGRRR